MAPIGSITPRSEPNTNDLHRLLPAARMGMEIMAPSGMFRMAMPNDTEMAAANDMCGAPFSAPANTTPTAMPSGRLCMVTFNAEFFTVATRFILLFYVYACKAYYINLFYKIFRLKSYQTHLFLTFIYNYI